MTQRRPAAGPPPAAAVQPIRLDLTVNPFGASCRVYDEIAARDDLHLPVPWQTHLLRTRLAALHQVPETRVTLANGIDELLLATMALAEVEVVLFPPTDPDQERLATLLGKPVIGVSRSHRFAVELDLPLRLERPHAVGLVMSPNDPTGTLLTVPAAVHLARSLRMLVVDERHGAYSPRTLLPLVGEFDNVVVLRTFETWAGLAGFPIAYAIAPERVAAAVAERLTRLEPAAAAVVAALATLDDARAVDATVLRIRDEKSRLFRTLRKLNMIRPYPSWANFLLCGIERGERAHFVERLAADGIAVHVPCQPVLAGCLRISATTPEATMALKKSLISAAAAL